MLITQGGKLKLVMVMLIMMRISIMRHHRASNGKQFTAEDQKVPIL